MGNKYPKDPEILKKALQLRGVEICNQWFSSFLISKPFEEVEKEFRAQLSFLKAMGAKIIGASEQSYSVQGQQETPVFGQKYVMDDKEWKEFRAQLSFLKAMGAKIIGASEQSYSVQGQQETPVFGQKYVMDDKEWELLCSGLDRLGKT